MSDTLLQEVSEMLKTIIGKKVDPANSKRESERQSLYNYMDKAKLKKAFKNKY